MPPCSVGHHLLSQLSCISTFHSNLALTTLNRRKHHLLPASQFSYNYWELLNWNIVLSHRMKGWPGITGADWLFTFQQHCATCQVATATHLLTSPASTHLTCRNSCSEVSAAMRTDAVTHCSGCMQVLRHRQLQNPPCSRQNLCELNIQKVQNLPHL